MASSSNLNRNYHVFLSFRGTDVRKNFLSHLYAALDEKGIHTFVDREELRIGEQISTVLMKAIEESRVAIIIFSEDYASSPWCLEEVAKIMECQEQKGLIVFPVFYKVEPREVRRGRQSYGRAMAKHESNFGKDSEKVRRWKKALSDAGSLSGWNSNDRDEAKLIQCIVKELSIHLDRTPLDVAKYPVGIDSRVQELLSLSKKESGADDVLMIGLWGPGGIGKTTIAKALYNAIERQFQGSSFLARVRETSNQSNGLIILQQKLLSQILFHKAISVYSCDEGISLIRERLRCKKVLLVLDDVDQMDQLNALAGKGDWFGKGSRIIVTSRDKHLLTSHGINYVHEVQSLGCEEALDLFGQHAFPNGKRAEIRRNLIHRALHYANGLPLALEMLGSFLCGRNESAWESALEKLSKSPDQTINRVLKTSFDGLEDNEREIFLDIACFFKGKRIEYIKKVLDSCGFATTIGIEILIERSLIKNEYGTLQMHDLVQLMGNHIVDQECPCDPRERSRIWLFEDAVDILCENTETNAVKAIVLNGPARKKITISPDAFANMKMLRMLILHVHISSRGPVRLPNELRWLEWPQAPDLEFGSGPKKLVSLHFGGSRIKQLGSNFQNFRKLKSIELLRCKFFTRFPDLSSAPNLEVLRLTGCRSLVEVHQSVGYLKNLKKLSIFQCRNLSKFPSTLRSKSLEWLSLKKVKIEKFPDILVSGNLRDISLSSPAIKEVPASIGNLVSVHSLCLSNCKNLATLPSSIYKMKNLQYLRLQYCSNFVMFPKNLKDASDPDGNLGFQNLRSLNLVGCNLQDLEFLESSSSFPKLKYLDLLHNDITHRINECDFWKRCFVRECKRLQDSLSLPSDCLVVQLSSLFESEWGNVADKSSLEKVPKTKMGRSGREMPEWILPCNKGFISFMVPQDLYDKFLGLAICIVSEPTESQRAILYPINIDFKVSVNGERLFKYCTERFAYNINCARLLYVPRSSLNGVEKLLQNEQSHFEVRFIAWEGRIRNCGIRLVCEQQEDDERVCTPTTSADANTNLKIREKRPKWKTIFSGLGRKKIVQ